MSRDVATSQSEKAKLERLLKKQGEGYGGKQNGTLEVLKSEEKN